MAIDIPLGPIHPRSMPFVRNLCFLVCCLLATVTAATPANQVAELSFPSTKAYADPFNEVTLDLLVTRPDGSACRLPAFWAGGQTWRARFSSPVPGRYTYTTECSDPTNPSLHRLAGSIDITPYEGDNPLYRHGPVRVSSDKQHFEHADHTPFFWLADTWWMGLCKRLPFEGFRRLAADRAGKGFTVVQIVAGLYPDMPAFDPRGANEAGFPWTERYERVNPAYFDAADRRIATLADHGLAPCLVGAWGYHLPWLGVDKMKRHWRYLVARYGAYPCFWCIAGEAAMPYYLSTERDKDIAFQKQGWTEVARYVRSIDPFHHPITLHPTDRTRTNIADPAVIDFEMLQTGHGDWASVPNTLAQLKASRESKPKMPTVNAEVCYEGILGTCHDDVVRFMAWTSLLSGTAGHTYGANGIWQVNTQGHPYGKSPHGGTYGPTPWDEAMNLPGSREVGLAKKLLESVDFPHLRPHPELAAYAPQDDLFAEPHWSHWIWYPEGDPTRDAPIHAKRYFRKTFSLPEGATPTSAVLWISVDDRFTARLNGHLVGSSANWQSPAPLDVTRVLKAGENTLFVEAENLPAPNVHDNPAGLLCTLRLRRADGQTTDLASDSTWESSTDAHTWSSAKDLGPYGRSPWGRQIATAPAYPPFTAATPDGRTRVTYVPAPRSVVFLHLDPRTTYAVDAIDPATGATTHLGPAAPAPDGTLTLAKPPTTSNDWVLELMARQ